MSIQEIQTRLLDKGKIHCQDYDNNEDNNSFIGCCKEKIWDSLRKNISCRLTGFENLMPNQTDLRDCDNRREAIQTFIQGPNIENLFCCNRW